MKETCLCIKDTLYHFYEQRTRNKTLFTTTSVPVEVLTYRKR